MWFHGLISILCIPSNCVENVKIWLTYAKRLFMLFQTFGCLMYSFCDALMCFEQVNYCHFFLFYS